MPAISVSCFIARLLGDECLILTLSSFSFDVEFGKLERYVWLFVYLSQLNYYFERQVLKAAVQKLAEFRTMIGRCILYAYTL